MVGWHHRHNGHGFGWTPGVGDGQGGLACCDSWGRKESDTTEWLNWTELKKEESKWSLWLTDALCTGEGLVDLLDLSSPPISNCPYVAIPAFLVISILSAIGLCKDHTWADDSCILVMPTVVSSPAPGRALPHVGFLSSTFHFCQPDGPWSCPKVSRPLGIESFSTAQLPAHHVGIVQVPAVITDGAPGVLVKNFHSPSTGTIPIHQAELSALWGERNGTLTRGMRRVFWGCRLCVFRHDAPASGSGFLLQWKENNNAENGQKQVTLLNWVGWDRGINLWSVEFCIASEKDIQAMFVSLPGAVEWVQCHWNGLTAGWIPYKPYTCWCCWPES